MSQASFKAKMEAAHKDYNKTVTPAERAAYRAKHEASILAHCNVTLAQVKEWEAKEDKERGAIAPLHCMPPVLVYPSAH